MENTLQTEPPRGFCTICGEPATYACAADGCDKTICEQHVYLRASPGGSSIQPTDDKEQYISAEAIQSYCPIHAAWAAN
jgi:hypothetical protein